MKKLIIAEKPSLAMNIIKAIGGLSKNDGFYEGEKYIVTWAFGHLLTLCDISDYQGKKTTWSLDNLPYIPETFKFKIKDDNGVKKQFKIIETLISRDDVEEVVNCGDADREGEVIINNIIYTIFKKKKLDKKITRLWLPEQTADTIRKALNNLQPISKTTNLMQEGLARTYIDWLYGINLTQYVTVQCHSLFPVGRVLVPIVKYIYDRDMAIKNFVPQDYLTINVTITKDNEVIPLNFKNFKFKDNTVETQEKVSNIINDLKNKNVVVKDIKNKEKILTRPKLFSLDTLQNLMFKTHKMSIKETLQHVQSLYEKGYCTYPRTNTEYLAENEKDKVKEILTTLKDSRLTFFDKKSIFDDSKIESHSAIIPTTKIDLDSSINSRTKLVYDTILSRFKSVFCKEDAVILENEIVFNLGEYSTKLVAKTISKAGFLIFEPQKEKMLPNFKLGEEFEPVLTSEVKQTTPPAKINEASLNKYLKNPKLTQEDESFSNDELDSEDGKNLDSSDENFYKDVLDGLEIGTVATRAGIIENAIKYDYIEKEKSVLSITPKGEALINNLEKLNVNLGVDKTLEVSKSLKDVYKEKKKVNDVVNQVVNELKSYIVHDQVLDAYKQEREVIGVCPLCGKEIYENNKAFSCSGYKEGCKFVIWKSILSKKITKSIAKELLNNKKTKKMSGFKSRNGKNFSASLVIKADGTIGLDF